VTKKSKKAGKATKPNKPRPIPYAGAEKPKRRKTKKWWVVDGPADFTTEGRGVSTTFSDRAFWLTPEQEEHVGWLNIVAEVDRTLSLQPLLGLLQPLVPTIVYSHLEDLARRYRLQRFPGRRATPSYDLSVPDALLKLACERVDELVPKHGLERALKMVAGEHIPLSVLRNTHKAGKTRHKRKPRPAPQD
jgi:hypothetical protein